MKILCSMTSAVRTLFLVALVVFVGCSKKIEDVVTLTGKTMGTTYSVKYVPAKNNITAEQMQKKIDQRLVEVNDVMSTFYPGSELSRLNKADAGQWISLSTDLSYVLKNSWIINQKSQGKYDVTVGPLVNLWGFGPTGPKRIPSVVEINNALKVVGVDKFEFDQEKNRILKKFKDSYIDLSSIAKGYGVDQVALVLEKNLVENYMVEIGGEIDTKGSKFGTPWKIAVQSPLVDNHDYAKILAVNNISMATSGNYRNFFIEGGRKFSHTIDPKVGKPFEHTLASVTVLSHENCMMADGWATALMALGPTIALEVANKEKLMVMLINVIDGKISTVESSEFTKFLEGK